MACAFNSSTWESQPGASLWVQDQPSLQRSSRPARETQWKPASTKQNNNNKPKLKQQQQNKKAKCSRGNKTIGKNSQDRSILDRMLVIRRHLRPPHWSLTCHPVGLLPSFLPFCIPSISSFPDPPSLVPPPISSFPVPPSCLPSLVVLGLVLGPPVS